MDEVLSVLQGLLFVIITVLCVVSPVLFECVLKTTLESAAALELAHGISLGRVGEHLDEHPELYQWFVASALFNNVTIIVVILKITFRLAKETNVAGDVIVLLLLAWALVISILVVPLGLMYGSGLIIAGYFTVTALMYVLSDLVGWFATRRALKDKSEEALRLRLVTMQDGYVNTLKLDLPNFAFHVLVILLVCWGALAEHVFFVGGVSAGGFLLVNLVFVSEPWIEKVLRVPSK